MSWTEWQTPIRKGYEMKCCDCGLTHVMEFRLKQEGKRGKAIQFRVDRVKKAKAK